MGTQYAIDAGCRRLIGGSSWRASPRRRRGRLFFAADDAEVAYQRLRAGERTGRPLGEPALIDRLESALGRRIHRQKVGPKPSRQRTAEMLIVSP
jgi:hypothetical protein